VFLYPLAVSLIVTGVAWRWIFNPQYGIENALRALGWESAAFNWLSDPQTAMYAIIIASTWQSSGFYMALMLAGPKGIDTEIWSAARIDGASLWRIYLEIIIPMMRFTFLTCAILLSLGAIKARPVNMGSRLFHHQRHVGRRVHHAADHFGRIPPAFDVDGLAARMALQSSLLVFFLTMLPTGSAPVRPVERRPTADTSA
jgi:ABC-type polysaccharide transport system permease subunit